MNNEKKILDLLRQNARISEQEIALRLNMTQQEVTETIKRLEDEQVILGYTTLVAPSKDSREVHAIIEVQVQPERDEGFDKVANNLAKFDEVVAVHLVSGRYDLRLEVIGKSLQEVAYFVASRLSTQPGVKSTATLFLLKKYKDSGILLDKEEQYERLQIVP